MKNTYKENKPLTYYDGTRDGAKIGGIVGFIVGIVFSSVLFYLIF